jgi:hypothetical protein
MAIRADRAHQNVSFSQRRIGNEKNKALLSRNVFCLAGQLPILLWINTCILTKFLPGAYRKADRVPPRSAALGNRVSAGPTNMGKLGEQGG